MSIKLLNEFILLCETFNIEINPINLQKYKQYIDLVIKK
ncbi:hypothetical protein Clopa_1865 [Clostridium pasteurianum BC1]|uniref:Uncharacterized protein n=1 Tax=Clostridium pasteurianum BC1 TaxID=86416 RepID=R4KAV1_CLOPA|nr:hypothetical protein Clopa_1865 [Clostridium pasteurianum BC1]